MSAIRSVLTTGLCALGVATATPVFSQGALRVTPFAGGTAFITDPPAQFRLHLEDDTDLIVNSGRYRDAVTLGILTGLHLSERWELEALVAWTPSRLEADGLMDEWVDAHAYIYGIHANYHLPLNRWLAPYLSAGIGGEAWEYGIAHAAVDHQLMAYWGGGMDLRTSEFFGIRLDARDGLSRIGGGAAEGGERTMHHLMLLAGLTFYIPTR